MRAAATPVLRPVLRPVLAAAIGALLISVSYPALAQEFDGRHEGEPPKAGQQQGETARAERQCEPLPANLPQTSMQQNEPAQSEAQESRSQPLVTERSLAVTPATLPEMRPATPQDERRQGEPERPVAQLSDQPLTERSVTLQPDMHAEPQRAEPAQEELEQFLAQLPERPLAERQGELEKLLAQLPERKPAEVEADEQRQPEAMKAEMEEVQPMRAAEMAWPGDPKWAALNEPGLGTTMDMPRALFSMADGHAHKGVGRRYKTPDGRAKVAIWTQHNTRRDSPAGYLRRTFVIPHAAVVDYERFTPDFAAVSGVYGARIFYIRCNLSPRGNLHCFDLAYPVREKKAWDVVVTRMSRSLRSHEY